MSEATPISAPIDVPRLRAALCRARQINGGNLLLFVVWLGLETASHGRDGSRVWAVFFGVFAVLMLVLAVKSTLSGNKTDDARAAGPTNEFVAHCRSVLTPVAGAPGGLKFPVFLTLWGLGGALLLVAAVSDVVGEKPPQYLHAATHAMFAVALFLRPMWNRFLRAPAMARELATLPPAAATTTMFLDAELVAKVRGLLETQSKIQAIKLVREATGVGLAEAKAAVEALET
jgi:hypothetical protein